MFIIVYEKSNGNFIVHGCDELGDYRHKLIKGNIKDTVHIFEFFGSLKDADLKFALIEKIDGKLLCTAVVKDVETAKKMVKKRTSEMKMNERKEYRYRIIHITKKSFIIDYDEAKSIILKKDKEKCTYKSQPDGSYIIYDSLGKWVGTADNYKELKEFFDESGEYTM